MFNQKYMEEKNNKRCIEINYDLVSNLPSPTIYSPSSCTFPLIRFSNLKIRGYRTTYFYFSKQAFRKLNFHLQRQASAKSTLLTLSRQTKTQFLNYVFAKTKVNRLIYLDFLFHREISVSTLRQLLKLDFYTALLHSSKGRRLTKSHFHESVSGEKFLLDEQYSLSKKLRRE